ELGAVPGLGERPLHRFMAAVFFREPVLGPERITSRHCEERRDEQSSLALLPVDCSARNDGYVTNRPVCWLPRRPPDVHDRSCRQPERLARARRTIQRLAVRAGEADRGAAEKEIKG